MLSALIIRPDMTVERKQIEPGIEALQREVGGLFDAIRLYPLGAILWIDDEGKFKQGQPEYGVNVIANSLVESVYPGFTAQDYVVGTVVLLGGTPDNPDSTDVPEPLATMVETFAAQVSATLRDDG